MKDGLDPASGAPTPLRQGAILPYDQSGAAIVSLTAFAMGFLAALALAAVAYADLIAGGWTRDLAGRLTVVLSVDPADDAVGETARRGEIDRALAAVRGARGVQAAELVSDAEMEKTLAPLLGADLGAAALAAPAMIDVRLEGAVDEAARAATADKVRLALRRARIDAEVETHGAWIARLEPAAARVRWLAYAALAVIAAAAALTTALACLSALAAHAAVIDVLKLVGARDKFIVQIFVRRFQITAFVGSAIGSAAAAAALALASRDLAGAGALAPLAPQLALEPRVWAQFAVTPLAFAVIAIVAARVAVEMRLRRGDL